MCGVDSGSVESVVQNEVEVAGDVALGTGIGIDVTEKARGGKGAKLGFRKYGSYGKRSGRERERAHVCCEFQILSSFHSHS